MGKKGRPTKRMEANPSPAHLQVKTVPFKESTTVQKRCKRKNQGNLEVNTVPFKESTTVKKRGKQTKAKESLNLLMEEFEHSNNLIPNGDDSSFHQQEPGGVAITPEVTSSAASLSIPKQNEHCLHQAISLGYTDFAATLVDDSTDPDEVDSLLDTGLVKVEDYIVKKEIAPLLKSILDKQGNIAMHCLVESTTNRSSLLENVFALNQNLEKKNHNTIKTSEVKSMMVEVRDFEKTGMDVKWLQERLEEIAEALEESKGHLLMKKEVERIDEEAERTRKKLEELREKARLAERKNGERKGQMGNAKMLFWHLTGRFVLAVGNALPPSRPEYHFCS